MSTTAANNDKNADAGAEGTSYERINDFGAVRISLASPQDIRSWSHGEVKKPETINYRTYRPEKDGLFCEKIFGPEKDWECSCGKYRGMKYKGMICDRCGVKVTHSRVRRKRMGHIELAAPVVHIWFFKAMPSRLGTLLDMKTTNLEKIIYFQDYVVVDPMALGEGDKPILKERQLLNEEEFKHYRTEYGDAFEVDMGAEAIKKLLDRLDLVKLSKDLRDRLEKETARGEKKSKQREKELVKRLKTVEALCVSSNQCAWMVLECIPVIPPDLRPLVLLDSGNFATSDLNDLYRRIINRNNRLKKLVDLNAPEVIIRNEKRMLQQSVDALFDNNRCKRPVLGSSNRPLKSLTDMIKGKQGRFRENLLGKRVDYSARSVIVVGPELKLHQCGLPKKIALELFQPFIIRRLKELNHADTIKSAKKMLERKDDVVWDILEEVTKTHPVLLNRAPTLHRMGIQAFEPVLIEGNAIRIHPLVCKGFNADFDGDQMAVHLPLSIEAQVEATVLMMSTNNIFSPANGNPIITPSQDIVMGCYYLTAARGGEDEAVEAGDGMVFHSPAELFRAHAEGKLGYHAKVRVRMPVGKKVISEVRDEKGNAKPEELPRAKGKTLVRTTVGRVIFNDNLHPDMDYYDLALSSKYLSRIIADCYQRLGRRETIALLDRMKETGFRHATRSGLSFAASDLRTPENKEGVLKEKDKDVEKVRKLWERGHITETERYNKVIDTWMEARDQITKKMMTDLQNDRRTDQVTGKMVPYLNPIYLMAHSGARGGIEQIRQLAGMRGLMAKPSGAIIETPIKSNFREGLTVLEYFSSTHGARKGLADTALKTADSGYLTRKLADVAQNVVITMHDCGTTQGISKGVMYKGDEVDRPLSDAIRGRVSRNTIAHPTTGAVLLAENEMITPAKAKELDKLGIDKITVRSPMTCQAPLGICRLCYGMDLATGSIVEDGMAVGIIAAQSIGEPGTQLTMRTFHIGGVASKGAAVDSEHKAKKGGYVQFERVTIVTNENGHKIALAPRAGEVTIAREKDGPVTERYGVPHGAEVLVAPGGKVEAGMPLVKWDPHSVPLLAEEAGVVKYKDLKEGVTVRKELDKTTGVERFTIMEHKGDMHPQIIVMGEKGKEDKVYYIHERANLMVADKQKVSAGTLLAKTPREVSQTQDITGGLPRVTELFEARRPRSPAVMAEVAGRIRIDPVRKRGKRIIEVIRETEDGKAQGEVRAHQVPAGAHLRVHPNEYVKEGDALVHGPLVPHDILKIRGEQEVQEYLVREVQSVYRSQRVDIDDKHIEIIVAQMLRKVKVTLTGDTPLLPGAIMDKFAFNEMNRRYTDECVKVASKGDTELTEGRVYSREAYDEEVNALEKKKKKPTFTVPEPASCEVQLLGITKAAVQSDSFISAASFQETTKVLTEAALASKVDYLVGLKENVILGHLIPAGTGFKTHQEAQVKINAPDGAPAQPVAETAG
ncbi:MAG: DNA-directed RNA polymerase subunit beta' [Planctomycetes bacterium]|nr:DNA-directed RNA polymerase subunit beta' [Planctomycetota bacterium]